MHGARCRARPRRRRARSAPSGGARTSGRRRGRRARAGAAGRTRAQPPSRPAAPRSARSSRPRKRRRYVSGPAARWSPRPGSGGRPQSCPSGPPATRRRGRRRSSALSGACPRARRKSESRPARRRCRAPPAPSPSRRGSRAPRARPAAGRARPTSSQRRVYDPCELRRVQARPAHECTVDVGLTEQLARVLVVDAAAVLDTDLVRELAVLVAHKCADERARVLRDLWRGDLAGPDRPDRLVGDHHPRDCLGVYVLERFLDLVAKTPLRLAVLALVLELADTQDRLESGSQHSRQLALQRAVGFAEVLAPLRVADHDARCTDVLQHRARELAGERAAVLLVTFCASTLSGAPFAAS